MFPNPTDYFIRVNYYNSSGSFVRVREVHVSDESLCPQELHILNTILLSGTEISVCENCLTSDEAANVRERPGGRLLCDECFQAGERSQRRPVRGQRV